MMSSCVLLQSCSLRVSHVLAQQSQATAIFATRGFTRTRQSDVRDNKQTAKAAWESSVHEWAASVDTLGLLDPRELNNEFTPFHRLIVAENASDSAA